MSIEKVYYRPYLTGEEIDSIVSLFSQQLPADFISNIPLLNAYKKIHELKLKKDNKAAFVAHTTKGSIKEQLKEGLDLDGQSKNKPAPIDNVTKRAKAWEKFQSNPANCSTDEIDMVQTYRRENNLMSEEEKEQHDANIMNQFNF